MISSSRIAAQADDRKKEFKSASKTSYSHVKDGVIALMRTVYYKATHMQPFDDMADMVELQILNVSIHSEFPIFHTCTVLL